jgi:hypothetical protein
MAKFKKIVRSPACTAVLFILAAVLLLSSSIAGTRAALTYYSETYTSRVEMYDIGVSLVENGAKVSWRDYGSKADGSWNENTGVLLGNMLAPGEEFKLGKRYDEVLSVTNSGTIDEYVRVTVYRYWLDAQGNKMTELSPDQIDLHYVNLDDCWILDEASSTPERMVLYYDRILPSGESTPPFTDSLTIDGGLAAKVSETTTVRDGYTVVTTDYDYDGVQFRLEAEVHAVQTHNAEDAIWSAWGRHVTIDDGRIVGIE